MSNFFEDLGKKIGETAESVSNYATEAVEVQKLKHQIRNLARSNSYDLEDLGRAVYQRFLDGSLEDETATELCGAIQEREEQIDEFNKKIAIIKGEQKCPVCGNTVSKGMIYCPFCGNKMPDFPEPEVEEETMEEADKETGTEEAPVEGEAASEGEAAAKEAEEPVESVEGTVEGEAKTSGDKVDDVIDKAKDIAAQAADLAAAAADKASEKFHEFVDKVNNDKSDK